MPDRPTRVATPSTTPLRDVRHRQGLSLKQVETLTGLNRAQLSRIEHGLAVPTGRQIRLIAHALNLDPDRLVIRTLLELEEPA